MATRSKAQPKPPKLDKLNTSFPVKRSEDEINGLLNVCSEWDEHGDSQFRGKTYEQGMSDAINWLRGDTELEVEPPEDPEDDEDDDDLDDEEEEDEEDGED